MKKHFYSLVTCLFFVTVTGLINPVFGQKYCYPTFSGGGCNGYDLEGISVVQGTNTIFSASPSCVSTGVDTSGLNGTGIVVYRGKTYALTINGSTTESYAAYIDYQHDGSFEDVGDYVADDINDLYSTITQNITIPLNAKPVVTRMRVIAGEYTTLNYNTECSKFIVCPSCMTPTGGSSQDYKITITAFPNDIGIIALNPAYCPTSKEPVQVIIQNIGLNTLTSIPFTFKVGSTTVSSTYGRTLASNTQDTFTIGTFDAHIAGTYKVQIYANLSNDGDRTNDTINTSLHIAQPAAPIVSGAYHCGPGAVYLDAKSKTPNTSTYWFKSDTTAIIYKKNTDSILTPFLPIGATDTFYAESRFATNTSITKGNWAQTHTNGGSMFDVFAQNTVIIDSFEVNAIVAGTGTSADSVVVDYKLGTYSGYQADSKAWTHLATVPVFVKGGGNKTRVVLPRPFTLTVGQTYGLFFYMASGQDEFDYDVTYLTSNPLTNGDLTITAGSTTGDPAFSGYNVVNGRDWDGTIYYHLNACPSPRLPVSITMLQNPNGAYLAKTAPFQGKYNLGDEVHADQICAADTNTYTIMPPIGMTESDYGTKWTVNSIKISTVRGTVLPNSTVTMPTVAKNGVIQVYPTATYGDSVFVIAVDMKTPATGCDSTVFRYLNVSANPKADFSFTNPCGNVPVVITDLSNVPSAIDTVKTWTWDFGDGSTTNLNRKNPYPHLYATPGTYTVSLKITSTPGCPASVSKTLQEYAVPVTKFGNNLPCNKQPISYLDSSTLATSATITSWAWDFGDGTKSAIQKPVHTYPKSGPYTVKLVTTSSQGCQDSLIKTVRVQPIPTPVFKYNNACVNAIIYMSAAGTIDTNLSSKLPTLKWNYGDGTGSTSTTSHTYTSNGSYVITLTATSGDGCIADTTKTITPYSQPIPKITYKTVCVGQTVPFVDSSGSGNTATYSWTFGDGGSTNNLDSPEVYHAYTKTGTYTVGLTIVSGLGCTGSGSGVIVVPGYPAAGFTANNVCIGGTTVFKNTSTGMTTPGSYFWNFGDTTYSNLAAPTHTYLNVGQDSVTLTATNKYGCADSTKLAVLVNPYPVIRKWTTKVHNLTFQFLPADTTIGTFEWHFDVNDSSSLRKPIFTYPNSASGVYQTVKLYVTNKYGCTTERTDSVKSTANGIEVDGKVVDGITVFPNPFEGTTNINYTLPSRSDVRISVYDAEGKLVAKLKDGTFGAGAYTDAFDANKYHAADGVYYLKMYINEKYYTTKIVNVK